MNFKEADFNVKLANVLMIFGGFSTIFIPIIGAGFFIASICLTYSRMNTKMAHTFVAALLGLISCLIIFIISIVHTL